MTLKGAANAGGNVFSVATNGSNYQNLVAFTGAGGTANGWFPSQSSLNLVGTTLYGMTYQSGDNGDGSIFSVGADGANYQELVSFTGTSGSAIGYQPFGGLTREGATLYGMTCGNYPSYYSSIFSVTTDGTNYQNLLSFTGATGAAIGRNPIGNLTLAGTTLYGMTPGGGASNLGNILSVGSDGSGYQNLVSFTGVSGTASGVYPGGNLTLSGSTLFGMTEGNGVNYFGNVFCVGTNGTNYKNLLSFTGTSGSAISDGPWGSLILAGTTLYGLTSSGGSGGFGNIFSVAIDGTAHQNLYSFNGGTDGQTPWGDLTMSGGTLFGMNETAGANGDGTLFALTLPIPEPDTLALVGAAVVSEAYRRRRRWTRWKNRR